MKLDHAVGKVLSWGLNIIIDKLNKIGLPATGDNQWHCTIILRNVAHDHLTVLCGQDDEAALIIALQQLGASRGLLTRNVTEGGFVDREPE